MAYIKKIKEGTETIYPATIPQAVVDPTSGKSVRTELDEKAASAELAQLAGDVLKGKYDFKREFNHELDGVYRTVLFNYPLLANDILNLKFEFSNITNDLPSPFFDFGGYDNGFGSDKFTKYFGYTNGAYVYEHQYVPVQDYPQFAILFRAACGVGDFKLTISNDRTILKVIGDIDQINNKLLELPKVSSTSQFAAVARKNIDPAERLTGAIHTRTNNLNEKVFERYTGETVENWLNPSNWKNIESVNELINKIPMGDDIQSCNITGRLGSSVNINGNVYEATGNGTSIYPRMEGFIHEPMKAGHKYFITFKRYIDFTDSVAPPSYFQFGTGIFSENNIENQSDKEYTLIYTPDSDKTLLTFRLVYGTAANSLGVKLFIRDFMVFDLTEFFGAGKEPTVDDFKLMIDEYGYFDGGIDLFKAKQLVEDVNKIKADNVYPKKNDVRFLNDFSMRELDEKISKYQNTIESLRKIKTADAGEISLNIANQAGVEQRDVIIRLYLHKGVKPVYADDTNFDIWLNDLCNKDFSDIRFLDNNDNLLDCYKHSHGNYSLIPDSTLGTSVSIMSDGSFVRRVAGNKTEISTDNGQTWTNFLNGLFVGEAANGDVFFYLQYGDADLYKATKASNFATSYKVLWENIRAAEWFLRSYVVDDLGYIYLGEYQAGVPARAYRSTDNGETWSIIFEKETLEHVHSLHIDKNVTPNRIYINNDSLWTGEGPSTYYSDDRGATWIKFPLVLKDGTEFKSDYGVMYSDPSGYTLGGGEGGIKGTPTIFKTRDGISEAKLSVMQNTHAIQRLGESLYCGGTAYEKYNRYAQIYRSNDEGETWEAVNFVPYTDEEGSMQYGYRFYTLQPLPMPDGQECHVLGTWIPGYPTLRIIEGGENYQAMFFVKIPILPAAGTTIKIAHGYLAEDVEGSIFSDRVLEDDLIVRYKLNEFGAYMYNDKGDEEFINLPDNWINKTKHFGWLVPVKYITNSAAVKFSSDTFLPIKGFHKNKGFTVTVWGRMFVQDANDAYFMFGRATGDGNDMYFYRSSGYLVYFKYGTQIKNFSIYTLGGTITHDAFLLCISISDDATPLLTISINGIDIIKNSELTGFDNNMDDSAEWRLGGAFIDKMNDENTYWTDMCFYNKVLSFDEKRVLFEGTDFIKI